MKGLLLLFMLLLFYTDISAQAAEAVKDEVWKRELQYWQYVKNNDIAAYRMLWHDNFVGYPETERLTGKDKIANWITDAYNTKGRHYEFLLDKKLVNPLVMWRLLFTMKPIYGRMINMKCFWKKSTKSLIHGKNSGIHGLL